ncbi:hypothetical protein ABT112_13060 [Streptomyces sp. NPDC002055]|uniref:hypothetical protein n=1 Tax=Streptomyces sp. NPDC002055 TaxID=3154534 RepID=UPI003319F9DA
MPTPYGSRGAMAFSAAELCVVRRALALALQPASDSFGPDREEEVQKLFRLAGAVDEAVREGGRLRAFLLADLARSRAALPGAATAYLTQLREVLADGYLPGAEDLAALRGLCAEPAGEAETERRRVLLHRCEALAERALRSRLVRQAQAAPAPPPARPVVLPGGRAADEPSEPKPEPRPGPKAEPQADPKAEPGAKPEKSPREPDTEERRGRPVPTPAEVFPPRRRRQGPPSEGLRQLAAG